MSIEEKLPCVELDHDAGHRPNVTSLVPNQVLKDDLGCSVLPGVNDQGVPLVVVSCATKVNYLDLGVQWSQP